MSSAALRSDESEVTFGPVATSSEPLPDLPAADPIGSAEFGRYMDEWVRQAESGSVEANPE